MGWRVISITAPIVIIESGAPNTGLFEYAGTPALGNPPQLAIVAPGVTTDPFGNLVTSSKILMQGNVITMAAGIFRTAATAPLIQLDGNHNAYLQYNAAAQLTETIAPVITSDGLGNTVQAGFTSYVPGTPSTFSQLFQAALRFGHSGNTVNPQFSSSGINLVINSGQDATHVVEATAALISDLTGGTGIVQLGPSSNTALELTETTAVPAALAGGPVLFGNSGGHAEVVSDTTHGDGNSYDVERLTLRLASIFTINNTIALTIFSKHLGIGTYEVEVWMVTQNTTAADAAVFAFSFSGTATGLVDFTSMTTGTAVVGYGASSTITTTFNGQGVGGNQQVRMNLTITVTVAGTLALNGAELVAGNTITISTGSRMRICPIVAT